MTMPCRLARGSAPSSPGRRHRRSSQLRTHVVWGQPDGARTLQSNRSVAARSSHRIRNVRSGRDDGDRYICLVKTNRRTSHNVSATGNIIAFCCNEDFVVHISQVPWHGHEDTARSMPGSGSMAHASRLDRDALQHAKPLCTSGNLLLFRRNAWQWMEFAICTSCWCLFYRPTNALSQKCCASCLSSDRRSAAMAQ
jgi:hypothetical protein